MKSKAKALLNMALITLKRLKLTKIANFPSNSLIDYYDIIHKLLEGISSIKNKKFKGEKAHYELIEYSSKEDMIKASEKELIQQIRLFRNKIQYEGFNIKKEYIEMNKDRIEKIIEKLKIKLERKIRNN